MMKMKNQWARIAMGAIAGAALLAVTSCSDSIEGKETTQPAYIKAKADRDAGRYQAAADGLNDLLLKAPKSALLHKELAALYGDHLGDGFRAVYHYQRYLEFGKVNPEDKRQIQGFIAECKRKSAEQMLAADPTISSGNPADAAELEKLRLKVDFLKQRDVQFQNIFQKQKDEIARLKTERPARTPATRTAAHPAGTGNIPAASVGADVYTVVRGDTLSRITQKIYGSNTEVYRKLIIDANNLSHNGRIREGQKLQIPKLPR